MANVVVTGLGPLYHLDEVKQHLRVDHVEDDIVIQSYMDAAERKVLQYCNLALVPHGESAAFKTAAIMAVMDYYDRGSASQGLPLSSRELIDAFRWLRV